MTEKALHGILPELMHFGIEHIRKSDPEVAQALDLEIERQNSNLELIASENFTSRAVLEAAGSTLTNKYAEGYPGKRYYGGCEYVDMVETLAIERAKKLFGADHANVQPHAGSQANFAAYLAFLEHGDTVLGMNLTHGGHLTHGSPVNVSGMYFKFVPYGVNQKTERIDYDELRTLAKQNKPKMIVAGATAYPRAIDFKLLRQIADEVGAYLMVDMAHIAGLIVGGFHPSPVPHSHVVTSTTHKTLRGPRSGFILAPADHAQRVDKAVFPGSQGGPLMHIIAAKAVAFKEAMTPEFKAYQGRIVENAKTLAAELGSHGLRIISGGTDTHLMLLDVKGVGLTGKEAEKLLGEVKITVNKNTIPFDTEKPFVTSGIRIGTPAVTTRGMGVSEMKLIAGWIAAVLKHPTDSKVKGKVAAELKDLCKKFPLYDQK